MAASHAECIQMVDAFRERGVPLWVAYYRRALPRFLRVRDLLRDGAIGRVTSVHVEVTAPLLTGEAIWRLDPAIAGGGLFFDLGSHCVDLIDFLCGPMTSVAGFALNTGAPTRSRTSPPQRSPARTTIAGTGIWNFNAAAKTDVMTFVGSEGTLRTPIFSDTDVVVTRGTETACTTSGTRPRAPALIQSIVNELRGDGRCESTAESGARASWVLEQCVAGYYGTRRASAARRQEVGMHQVKDKNADLHGNVPESSPVALLLIDVINDMDFDGRRGARHAG